MNSRMLAIGAIVLMLLLGGAGFSFYTMKMNKEVEIWVPSPLDGIQETQRDRWVEEWLASSEDETVLRNVVKNQGLVEAWGTGDEAGAIEELRKRKVVDRSKDGLTMRFMVKGKRKELDLLKTTSGVLYKETSELFFSKHPELKPRSNP